MILDTNALSELEAKATWLEETVIEIVISEAQGEVAEFKKWGVDIIPHRERMKKGFEVGEKVVSVEDAFNELILQEVFTLLPTPPFDEAEKVALAGRVYQHVWQQSSAGNFGTEAA